MSTELRIRNVAAWSRSAPMGNPRNISHEDTHCWRWYWRSRGGSCPARSGHRRRGLRAVARNARAWCRHQMLPHAVKELASLGLLPALDAAGVRTRELVYANRLGQTVWQELRGIDAGYAMPQFSIHRGKLHGVLLRAVFERLGAVHIHTNCRLVGFQDQARQVIATFDRHDTRERVEVAGDALIGAAGTHSRVRWHLSR